MSSLAAGDAVVVTRKYALVPVREALQREGRKQAWLRSQLGDRVGIQVGRKAFSSYLNGYARIPRPVLSAMCWIVSTKERPIAEGDVLARVADESVLIQGERQWSAKEIQAAQASGRKGGRASAAKRAARKKPARSPQKRRGNSDAASAL